MEKYDLSPQQVWLFRHNGFLKIPHVLAPEQVSALRAAILSDVAKEAEPVVRNAEGRVVRLSRLLDRDPIFSGVVASEAVLGPLTGLLGPNIEIVLNRHNHATLNLAGKAETFHRDVVQWTRSLVTVISYLERTTFDNGCTLVVPGSHLWPGVSTLHNLEKGREISQAGLLEQALPVPMPSGGMLALDSLVFHRVGENVTDQSRMSITIGYHSADELLDDQQPKRWLVKGERVYRGNDR
jgi:phytanoyl-CoA hydroxylase